MAKKPECAADKRNRYRIRCAVRDSVFAELKELHYHDGCMSLLNDGELAGLATDLTTAVMLNKDIRIILKRKRS